MRETLLSTCKSLWHSVLYFGCKNILPRYARQLSVVTEFIELQAVFILQNMAMFSNFWQFWMGVTQLQAIQTSSSMSANILLDATGTCCHF